MAVLDILTAPDPRLRVESKPVTDIAAVQTLIDDLLDTLYATDNGVGLAAPQVGLAIRMFIIDCEPFSDSEDLTQEEQEILKNFRKTKTLLIF